MLESDYAESLMLLMKFTPTQDIRLYIERAYELRQFDRNTL